MHSVLRIQELLTLIFRSLNEGVTHRRPTLSTLAQVCKSFHDIALDELWRTQISLVPILLVLLGDAIQLREVQEPPNAPNVQNGDIVIPNRALYLARPLTESDIKTLRKYASRVRELQFSFERSHLHYAIDDSIVQALKVAMKPLFPNLREFDWYSWRWYPEYTSYEPFYELLLAPKVQLVDIHYYEEQLDGTLLTPLLETCPEIGKLVLTGDPTDEVITIACQIIPQMKHLEDFSLCHHLLSWPLWKACASLSTLQVLEINLDGGDMAPNPSLWTQMPARSMSIEILNLRTSDIQRVTDFLTNATFPSVENFSISLVNPEEPPSHRKASLLFRAMADALSVEKLDFIFIYNRWSWRRFGIPEGRTKEDYVIQPPALRPLLKFKNLQKLWLRGGWFWDLDNAFVTQAAKAWPKLSMFILDPNHLWPAKPRVTLDILECFVEYLPNLEIFGVTLDAMNPPNVAKLGPITARPKVHTKLRAMLMQYSLIDSDVDVAAYLSRLFPDLVAIDGSRPTSYGDDDELWYDSGPGRMAEKWTGIVGLISAFNEVRKEERKWFKAEDVSDPVRRAQISLERTAA